MLTSNSTHSYFWQKKTIISFIAIIFVIIIHNSATNQYTNLPADQLTNFTLTIRNLFAYNIGAAAVPIFFFLSGIAFFRDYTNRKYSSKLHSRIKTLIIPYLIWNILGLLFAILYTYTPLSQYISGHEPFTPTIQNVLSGIFLYKYNFHFWFLFDLIIFTLLAPVFNLLIKRKWFILPVIIFLLIIPTITDTFLHIRLNFIIFYYLGAFIGKHYFNHLKAPATHLVSISAAILSIIIITLNFLLAHFSLSIPTIVSEILLVTLTLSLWFASDLFIPHLKFHRFYTTFFPIYAIHPYLLATIVKLFLIVLPHTSLMLLINEIFSPIFTIIISIPLIFLWQRFLPKTYALLFGERKSLKTNF